MKSMGKGGAVRAAVTAARGASLAIPLAACGSSDHGPAAADGPRPGGRRAAAEHRPEANPGIGDRLRQRVPADSHQVVAVYGTNEDSPGSTVVLFTKPGSTWNRPPSWAAHNGRKGWAADHHEGDQRRLVGVFTLSDAGGCSMPRRSFQAPHYWNKRYWHDFDYVIATDYNRVGGTPPDDPTRPLGQSKGGSIWLHMDHGSGTSACVSLPKSSMQYLLRTLGPRQHPVVVTGDKAELNA